MSLSSQTSSTPVSTENEDITSRVALDEQGSAQAAAAASSRMVCPICNEEMVGSEICEIGIRRTLIDVVDPSSTEQVGTQSLIRISVGGSRSN